MTFEQKEQLRQATLEVLVACHPLARPVHAIRRNVNREVTFHFTDEDLESALEFLRAMAFLEYASDRLGSTKWWQATPAGILQIERTAPPPARD